MPDDPGRESAFYDHENEPRRHVADWGGDDLFTRMPRRREVHTGPAPRFRRPAPVDPLHRAGADANGRLHRDDADTTGRLRREDGQQSGGALAGGEEGPFAADDRAWTHRHGGTGRFRRADAQRLGVPPVADDSPFADDELDDAPVVPLTPFALDPVERRWGDARAGAPGGRRTVVIAGRPEGVPRPPAERRRPPRTVAERVGPRPERIVAWAFALGVLLILIAIATADAATL